MSTPTPTRIPQPTRLLHASPSLSTKTSILSPKSWSSPQRTSTPKYQLQDPGVTPGSPKVIKRMTIRPPGSGVIEPTAKGNGTSKVGSIMDTEQGTDNTSTMRAIPSASLWFRPPSSSNTTSTPYSGRTSHQEPPAPQSASIIPTRIPIPRPRSIPNTRLAPTESRSRLPPSPAISICATVATAHPTPTQKSSIPIPTSRSKIPLPISPAVAISATVATASPSYRIELRKKTSELGSEVEYESNYSSASALALARYRTALPALKDVSESTGYDHELRRMSSTTTFSSASSLARHRISQRRSVPCNITSILPAPEIGQSVPMSTNTTTTEDMALVWQPDPESQGSDPAANLWMEIEARLNRGRVGVGNRDGRDERGQWILTRQRHRQIQVRQIAYRKGEAEDEEDDYAYGQGSNDREEEGQEGVSESWIRSEEMREELSEFTVSAYFDPDLSTPIAPLTSHHSSRSSRSCSLVESQSTGATGSDMERTAMFDMAAPLITSISHSGSQGGISVTPANTPLIHYETIQRVSRVRKSYSGTSSGSSSGSMRMSSMVPPLDPVCMISRTSCRRSDSSSVVVDLDHRNQQDVPESIPMIDPTTGLDDHDVMDSGMIRLDSHVQAALEVLSDNPESPTSITLDTDIQARSTHLGKYLDGEVEPSPYIEMDESTPMPIPIPHDNTPTYQYTEYRTRPVVSEDIYSNADTLHMEEVGLGIGMNLHLDSIYPLPVSSLLGRRDTNHYTSTSEASKGSTRSSSVGPMSSEPSVSSRKGSQDSYEYRHYPDPVRRPVDEICEREGVVEDDEEEEMLTVTDLDTGHRVDLSIKRLDELWIK